MKRRLAFVHGFTQTARSWEPVASAFRADCDVLTLDAPGHGSWADRRLDLVDGAAALAEAAGRAVWIGYSMGGRFALHVALDHPDVVEALVLVSATPGIVDSAERARRRDEDEQRARTLEEIGVDAFVDRWLALPMFAGVPADPAAIADRKANTVDGLASSLRLAGTGAQRPLWDRLGELDRPVQIVAGADDAKFVAIAESMHEAIAGSRLDVVAGAGHAVHLERPDEVTAILRRFLDDSV